MNDVPRHPEATIMAAFIEGTLPPEQVAVVAQHLVGCSDCRIVVAETARFEREEERIRPRRVPRTWWLAAAAVLAAIAVTVPLIRRHDNVPTSPIARLIELAPRQHRSVEARLSGFPWAQLQAPARGDAPPDPADLKLAGAAGEVLEKTIASRRPEAFHATGVAYLLIQRRTESIAALEKAASESNDARVCNDLAAARYAMAIQDEHPSQLPLALAAVDHALRLDARSSEALFNRALILERLGIRNEARKAWQRYLEVDGNSTWSVEARAHLRGLESPSSTFDPKSFESAPADRMVREFPQESRTWSEGPLLADWADAYATNDLARASAKIARARAIADALALFNGERFLDDAVRAIERARGRALGALVEAHRLYRDARIAYSKRDAGIAEAMFTRSAALFREGDSPMEKVAVYYAAIAATSQRRDGGEALTRLSASIDHNRYRALAAQIGWSQAVSANASGDWGSAVRAADAVAAAFRSLGEVRNAAWLDAAGAHALDQIGAADSAWLRRIRSCSALTETQDRARLGTILRSAATTLDSFGRVDGAAAMIDVAVDAVRDDPAQFAAALTERARLASRHGDTAMAGEALADARQAAASISDAALRATLGGSIDVADAVLRSRTEPRAAIATLDRAVAFFAAGQLRYLLPDAYLQRARAFRYAADDTAAARDYAAAMREIETQQNTIGDADLRLRFLDTAAQVIEESIELHLSRGSINEAFEIADGTRRLRGGATGADRMVGPPPPTPGTVVIEYVVLPHAIAIFHRSTERISVQKVVMERAAVAKRVASFAENIRLRAPIDQIRRDAATLYKVLIAPVRPHLSGVSEIVFVPDGALNAVPFAVLFDDSRNQYLVEQYTLRFAPSASAARAEAKPALEPAFVVADPLTPRWARLPASRIEGERIAAMYGVTAVTGEAATRESFIQGSKDSALIHYAGHADSDAGDSYGALLLARRDGDTGILPASEIARLSLPQHPLVILAACGTFRGEAIHVAGMSSIARAFLLAGARAVVGTLWEVDDDVAAQLFLRLHEHLRAGASPANAVRAAQLEMIHASDERSRHPASWGPVAVLSGS